MSLRKALERAENRPAVPGESIAGVARRFDALDFDGVIEIGTVPEGVRKHWSSKLKTDRFIITGERKEHLFESHPDMEGQVDALLGTLLDPDEVHLDAVSSSTAILWRSLGTDDGRLIRAVVSLALKLERSNSLISARLARSQEHEKAVARERRVWKRV